MVLKIIVFLSSVSLYSGSEFGCYWNNNCAYQFFGSKTPYDAVRGDIRDYKKLNGCQVVSFWSIHRHGNRNPGKDVTLAMKAIAGLKHQIVAAYDQGKSLLCAQDIDELRKWSWNDTLMSSQSFLTGIGYEELYNIGARVKAVYPELLEGTPEEYYFRATDKQRTTLSAVAFVHGFTDGTNLSLTIDDPREEEDVIKAYELCDKSQLFYKNNNSVFANETAALENSADYVALKDALQKRLGISYNITTADVFTFYEICRFHRAWDPRFRSPWCAVFSDEDLMVLEYKDDIKHYYRNGYGYWVNPRLGEIPLKDLYDTFESATMGKGKKMVSYFTHDTMMQMVICALGLNKDSKLLRGSHRDQNRLWRSSFQAPKAINLMAVLNRCQEADKQTHRVQIFIGEKVTDLCPVEGCTWQQFQKIFQPFTNASLDFCSLDYPEPEALALYLNNAVVFHFSWNVLGLAVLVFNL